MSTNLLSNEPLNAYHLYGKRGNSADRKIPLPLETSMAAIDISNQSAKIGDCKQSPSNMHISSLRSRLIQSGRLAYVTSLGCLCPIHLRFDVNTCMFLYMHVCTLPHFLHDLICSRSVMNQFNIELDWKFTLSLTPSLACAKPYRGQVSDK